MVQPLTAPRVSPLTMCFCATIANSSIGTMATIDAAAHGTPVECRIAAEAGHAERDRLRPGEGKANCDGEFVPDPDGVQDRRGGYARQRAGDVDPGQDLPVRCAFDAGGLVDGRIDLAEERAEKPDRQRQDMDLVHEGEAHMRVVEPGQLVEGEHRNDEQELGQHEGQYQPDAHEVPPPDLHTDDGVGGRYRDGERQGQADAGDDDGVQKRVLERIVTPELEVVGRRRVEEPEWRGDEAVAPGLQRDGKDPIDREQAQQDHRAGEDIGPGVGKAGAESALLRHGGWHAHASSSPRRCSLWRARDMTRISRENRIIAVIALPIC